MRSNIIKNIITGRRLAAGVLLFAAALAMTGCGSSSGNEQKDQSAQGSTGSEDSTQTGGTSGSDTEADQNRGKLDQSAEAGADKADSGNADSRDKDASSGHGAFSDANGVSAVHVKLWEAYRQSYNTESYDIEVKAANIRLGLDDGCASEYPELAAAFESYNASSKSRLNASYDELKADYDEIIADIGQDSSDYELMMTDVTEGYVLRADSNIVSIFTDYEGFRGGAHGDYLYSGLNFDTESGKLLTLSEIIDDEESFKTLLAAGFKDKYPDLLELMSADIDAYTKQLDLESENINWTIDNNSVTVYFPIYELGPYAMGAQDVSIYFDDARSVIKDKYMTGRADYAVPILDGRELAADTDGDGVRESIQVWLTEDENGWDYYVPAVVIDGKTSTVNVQGYTVKSYLVCSGGHYYVYLFTVGDSDYSQLSVVDAASGNYQDLLYENYLMPDNDNESVTESDGSQSYTQSEEVFTDPDDFRLGERIDMLGTHSAYRDYHVGANGWPESDERYYNVRVYFCLRNISELKCVRVDDAGNEIGEAVIPAGTYLAPVRTDKAGHVDLQIVPEDSLEIVGEGEWKSFNSEKPVVYDSSKESYRINYSNTGYPGQVDGVDEDKVFDGVNYVG